MMFVRSKDGLHLTEVRNADLEGRKILVNGVVFGTYGSEEKAREEFLLLCQECCDMETFYDLKGEIKEDEDDEDDDDDDDEDDGRGRFTFMYPVK